jgi:acyl-CoA thioesterase FadM/uncharacterized protein YndB with AHSA1/START domain
MEPEEFDPGPLAHVAHRQSTGGATLVFTRGFTHTPEAIWAALTDPEKLREWAPFTADRDLSGPGTATLVMIDKPDGDRLATTVSRADRPLLLEYTWGEDTLVWVLRPSGAGTEVTLLHSMRDRTMEPVTAAGWHLCFVVVDHLLLGQPIGPIVGSDAPRYGWEALRDAYAAALGVVDGGADSAATQDAAIMQDAADPQDAGGAGNRGARSGHHLSFVREFEVRWADVDPNMHLRASVYTDLADATRVAYFNEHEYPFTKLLEERVGPVLFSVESEFYREVLLGETIRVNLVVEAERSRRRKWTLRHEFWNVRGKKVAHLRVHGAWLDLDARRVTEPPERLRAVIDTIPRDPDGEQC